VGLWVAGGLRGLARLVRPPTPSHPHPHPPSPALVPHAPQTLLAVKGISDAKLEKLLECAKKMVNVSFISGTEALLKQKQRVRITTGSKELDALLGGGLETGSVTEVFGEFRTGKTQLAATLAVTAQLGREHGGGAGKVIYMDTENAFRPERVAQIASARFGLDGEAVLENLLVARCLTHEHQHEMLAAVAAKIAEDDEPFRLLVVGAWAAVAYVGGWGRSCCDDGPLPPPAPAACLTPSLSLPFPPLVHPSRADSVMGLYRVEFSGRGELAERQQKLGQHIRELVKIAAEFNVAVLVTNQVTAECVGRVRRRRRRRRRR
jgi:meiotic recombination protein DMC1